MKYIFANLKNNNVSKEYFNKLSEIITDNKIVVFPKKELLNNIDNNISIGLQNFEIDDIESIMDYSFVLLGHHDYIKDNNDVVNKKIKQCIELGYTIIVCCNSFDELKKDLKNINNYDNIIVAYEPHAYIGTGKIIDKTNIEEFIFDVRKEYSNDIRIVYGGGITKYNISELNSIKDLNGILVGSSSLDLDSFIEIINNY